MKQHFAFLFFLLLLSSFLVSPRLLQPPKGKSHHILYSILFYSILLYIISFFTAQLYIGEKEVQLNHRSFFHLNDNMEEVHFLKRLKTGNVSLIGCHFIQLMGSEECFVKDEGCNSRRMMVEAHLDYIYTQHHKP
ncbi:hypothetical protein V8G54_029677 [Vigna mungo]|uniref:Phytosulfokine n=1 Tax=Vigna mungo TaxID=3915 RepID=A0AAQ3RKJ5_VIGMU